MLLMPRHRYVQRVDERGDSILVEVDPGPSYAEEVEQERQDNLEREQREAKLTHPGVHL